MVGLTIKIIGFVIWPDLPKMQSFKPLNSADDSGRGVHL